MRKLALLLTLLGSLLCAAPALAQPAVVQTAQRACLSTPTATISLSQPVAAGDTLAIVIAGEGYGAAGPVVTGVSDPVDGAWAELENTGATTSDNQHYLSYSVYEVSAAKAASSLTITVTQSSGQSAASAVALEVNGSLTASNFTAQLRGTTLSAPTAPAGEFSVGMFAAYQFGQTFTAGSGWTLNGSVTNCTAALAESATPGSAAAPTVTVSGTTRYYAGTLSFGGGSSGPPPSPPSNTAPPTISGAPQQGQTLRATTGSWTGNPTSYSYQWQDCTTNGCSNISGATSSAYTLQGSDVGSTIEVTVTASNAGGAASATSAQTAAVTTAPPPPAPTNSSPPVISGTAQQGNTLFTSNGSWTGSPTAFAYQWQDCTTNGCSHIGGATGSSYTLQASDVGSTIEVTVTASNSGGSASSTSAPTATVTAGSTSCPGTIQPGTTSSDVNTLQTDLNKFGYNLQVDGYDGPATTADVKDFQTKHGLTANGVVDAYTWAALGQCSAPPPQTPANSGPPTVSGNAQVGGTLTATSGTWVNQPTSYAYQWRDDGTNDIAGATSATYSPQASDVGHTLDVVVTASNSAGSASATSAATAAVTPAAQLVPTGNARYLYTVTEGSIDVLDIGNNFAHVGTISLPQTQGHGVRGVGVAPSTHTLYVSYGGDGGGQGNGSLLAYDLVNQKVLWTQSYSHGVDSFAITPDGKTIYMPDGELSSNGLWHVIDASTGQDTGTTIDTGAGTGDNGPHNTIVTLGGGNVYMGDRNSASSGSNYLYGASTTTNQVTKKVGPFLSGIRPFTVNKENTLVYTSVTGLEGFQVGSLTTGKVLYTAKISRPSGASCPNSGASDPSHGVSLSPDEKQLYMLDWPCNGVAVFDVAGVPSSAPTQVAWIPVHAFNPNQSPCTYDCLGDGWAMHSTDGHYVFVGDSGDVIDTTTQKVVTNIPQLYQTRVFTEVDWANGAPSSTTTRSGLGDGRPTLPGQTIWPNNVSNLIFGVNDTGEWGTPNVEFTNAQTAPGTANTVVQGALKNAGIPFMRAFVNHNDFATGKEMSDAEIAARTNTIANVGATCLITFSAISPSSTPGSGQTMSDLQFAEHVATLTDGSHAGYARCDLFEIGNEPDCGGGPLSNGSYASTWALYVNALRKIRPDAKFIGPVECSGVSGMLSFLQEIVANHYPVPDAISWHWYPCNSTGSGETWSNCPLSVTSQIISDAQTVRNDLQQTLGYQLPIGISEWSADANSSGTSNLADTEPQMSNFITASLNAMAQAGLDFSDEFDVQSVAAYGGLDMFDSTNAPRPYFNAYAAAIANFKGAAPQ